MTYRARGVSELRNIVRDLSSRCEAEGLDLEVDAPPFDEAQVGAQEQWAEHARTQGGKELPWTAGTIDRLRDEQEGLLQRL